MRPTILGLAAALGLASCVAPTTQPQPASTIPPAPRHLMARVPRGIPSTGRCYTLSTQRMVYKVLKLKSDNRSAWDAEARGIPDTCSGTSLGDDHWYAYRLRTDVTDNLMLAWRNIDRKEFGYMVVKNSPTGWQVYSNTAGPWTPKAGEQLERTWFSDGKRINIKVFTPQGESALTANDIWVSFGS